MACSQGQFLRTERGGPMLCFRGYLYSKRRSNDQIAQSSTLVSSGQVFHASIGSCSNKVLATLIEGKCDQTHNQQSQGTSSHWIGWNERRRPKTWKIQSNSWRKPTDIIEVSWFSNIVNRYEITPLLNVVYWCLPQMRDCVPYHLLWRGTWAATLPWPQSNSNRYSLWELF